MQQNLTNIDFSNKNLKSLNEEFIDNPQGVKHLNISQNNFKNGRNLEKFPNLKTLIIDKNFFHTLQDFPVNPNITTLSANQNQFKDLDIFMVELKQKLPNVSNLSIMKNPMCPFFGDGQAYYDFRIKVSQNLPNLQILDGFETSMNDTFKPEEEEQNKNEEQKQQLIDGEMKGTIEYNKKYTKNRNQTIKDRSEGNRFIKNDQL